MKKIFICLLLVLLVGCTSEAETLENLDIVINEIAMADYDLDLNHSKEYYSYYVDPLTDSFSTNLTSNNLHSDNINIAMNLNVVGIIHDKFLESEYQLSTVNTIVKPIYTKSGEFINQFDMTEMYQIEIFKNYSNYLINVRTKDFYFTSLVKLVEIETTIEKIFVTLKSVKVDVEEVVLDYYNQAIIDYEKQTIDLFEEYVPTNGLLSELINSPTPEESVTPSPSVETVLPTIEENTAE